MKHISSLIIFSIVSMLSLGMLSSCKEKKKEAYERYKMLRGKLSPELAEELEKLMDIQLEIMPQELEESFCTGFKTGAKLMCEIFQKESQPYSI